MNADQAPPSGVHRPVSLSDAELATVRDITTGVLPDATVWIFGSRATQRARPYSDLDLLVQAATPLSWLQRAELRDRFEASDLPFRVDVVDAAGLASGFRARVLAERIELAQARADSRDRRT